MFVIRELADMLGNAQACISADLEWPSEKWTRRWTHASGWQKFSSLARVTLRARNTRRVHIRFDTALKQSQRQVVSFHAAAQAQHSLTVSLRRLQHARSGEGESHQIQSSMLHGYFAGKGDSPNSAYCVRLLQSECGYRPI